MKKIIACIISIAVIITFSGCETADENQNKIIDRKPIVAVITDEGGIGDYSFNDAVLTALENIQEENDIDIRCIEAENAGVYEDTIKQAVYEDATVVIAAGSHMKEAISSVAKEYPEKYFGIVDSDYTSDNVKSVSFADNESAFLAGVVAGLKTETNKVALVGGTERDTIDLYRYGFEAGLKTVNEDAEFIMTYAGSFLDKEKGYNVADTLAKDQGVDVIMHVAGASGLGVIDACKENNIWAIGADRDQSVLASGSVLCSVVKNMEEGIRNMVEEALDGNFKGEHIVYSLKDGGVDIRDNAGNIDKELWKIVESLKKDISDGSINVPYDADSLETFEIPEIDN